MLVMSMLVNTVIVDGPVQIGCRLHWDKDSKAKLPVCSRLEEYRCSFEVTSEPCLLVSLLLHDQNEAKGISKHCKAQRS